MTTDELLQKLPSKIGRNPLYENGEIIGYVSDEYEGCDIGWLYIHNEGKFWCAYYGLNDKGCVTLNPNDDEPPYNNAMAFGDTAHAALQGLYDWCVKNGFVKGGNL